MMAGKDRAKRLQLLGVVAWATIALALVLTFTLARLPEGDYGFCAEPCAAFRIFFFHVPVAWAAYLSLAVTLISSAAFLRTGSRRWDHLAHAGAEVGVLFGALVLITGPIWARPVWGAWWQWDARLTSMLVLWLTYVGYLLFRGFSSEPARSGRPAAVLGILGFLNVPIVHFSVYWWTTQHPQGPTPANLAEGSGYLEAPELTTFFVSLLGFSLLALWLIGQRVRLGATADRVEDLELGRAARAGAGV